jgi:hypothetical protein
LLAFSSADPGSDRGLACLHVRCGRESSHGPSSGRGLLAAAGQPAIDCRCRS